MAIGPRAHWLTAFGMLYLAAACRAPGPRPLAFGTAPCAHCHMTLIDRRFAGELVTVTGKAIPFDDVGCLATYIATGAVRRERISALWVDDFAQPDSALDVHHAVFLRSDSLHTPMDYHVVALRPGPLADSMRAALGGELLSWDEVLRLAAKRPGP